MDRVGQIGETPTLQERPTASQGQVEDRHDGSVTYGASFDWWIALVATIISGVVFTMTAGRGAPFWDCGEFIACAYILGIPHPPGAALFVILGRAVSIIPFGDTAFLLNLFSAYSSALAVGFCSLALSRILRRILGHEQSLEDRLVIYGGSLIGALVMAFGSTYWFNAVEAEVYGLTLLLVAILIWLSLIWLEKARTPEGNRILLLQTYLLFLGATNHMQAFMPIIPMFLLIILVDRARMKSPVFYILFFLLTTVIYWTHFFIIGLPIACAITFVGAFLSTDRALKNSFNLAGKFLLLAIVGYSLYAYVPIRSLQNPAIDENNPENWANFRMFLERKQYSDKSMAQLMFTRKGTWKNQFGTFHRIGFWGHLQNQWIPNSKYLYLVIPFLSLYALWAMWKRDRKIFLYFLLTLLLFTLAMTLYLNFSDGTRGVKLEVRDRDYFYTPGFVLISYLFGIGSGAFVGHLMRSSIPAGALLARALLVLLLLVPHRAMSSNYFTHDRSRFFVAEDLAYNMLVGLRENAILFTGGDNDTFPLWYIQEVRHFRKDVQVINLSLLNTPWYILQLKHQPPLINIKMDDTEIEALRGFMTPDGKITTVKDIMVPRIIRDNHADRPIYFAVTVPTGDRNIVKDKLLQEGLVVRVETGINQESYDIAKMEENFTEVYRFRGLADSTIYKDRDTIRLLTNYNACLFNLAQLNWRNGDKEKAQVFVDKMKTFPHKNAAGYRMLTAVSEIMNNWEDAVHYTDLTIELEPNDSENYVRRAEYLRRLGRLDDAIEELRSAADRFPGDPRVTSSLAAFEKRAQGTETPQP